MARGDDSYVRRLAAEVKRTYMEERRMFYIRTRGEEDNHSPRENSVAYWDGGRDHRGVVHKSKWDTIVQFALKHKVDPIELIHASFEMCESNLAPLPNQITSTRALEDLKKSRVEVLEDLKLQYASYTREAKQAFTLWRTYRPVIKPDIEIWKEVVVSSALELSPLYRYCLASGLGLTQLAEFWANEATMSYIRAPDMYDEVLGDAIPPGFREEAERVRKVAYRAI
jgi:hypothetical protein